MRKRVSKISSESYGNLSPELGQATDGKLYLLLSEPVPCKTGRYPMLRPIAWTMCSLFHIKKLCSVEEEYRNHQKGRNRTSHCLHHDLQYWSFLNHFCRAINFLGGCIFLSSDGTYEITELTKEKPIIQGFIIL